MVWASMEEHVAFNPNSPEAARDLSQRRRLASIKR